MGENQNFGPPPVDDNSTASNLNNDVSQVTQAATNSPFTNGPSQTQPNNNESSKYGNQTDTDNPDATQQLDSKISSNDVLKLPDAFKITEEERFDKNKKKKQEKKKYADEKPDTFFNFILAFIFVINISLGVFLGFTYYQNQDAEVFDPIKELLGIENENQPENIDNAQIVQEQNLPSEDVFNFFEDFQTSTVVITAEGSITFEEETESETTYSTNFSYSTDLEFIYNQGEFFGFTNSAEEENIRAFLKEDGSLLLLNDSIQEYSILQRDNVYFSIFTMLYELSPLALAIQELSDSTDTSEDTIIINMNSGPTEEELTIEFTMNSNRTPSSMRVINSNNDMIGIIALSFEETEISSIDSSIPENYTEVIVEDEVFGEPDPASDSLLDL